MKTCFRLIAVLAMAFLYIPIITLIVMSFNGGSNPYQMDGFSFRWYVELFGDDELLGGLKNTLIVAISSTAIAVSVGTLLALGLARAINSRILDVTAVSPAIIPDLVQGIGLLSLFALLAIPLGLVTVISGHAVFATAFVVAAVSAKLATLDGSWEEASRDLGASAPTTFLRVTLPTIAPGIVAGALLAFT
ncbi:MAG: ABC transporter permease, partial [Angustibacter sp.]